MIIFVGEIIKRNRKKEKVYDEDVLRALKKIWAIMDFPCGKRLAPSLEWLIEKLEKHGELKIDKKTRNKLLKISASTIDRLLKPEKKKMELKPKSKTKPGTLLKHQIAIRTFSEWDNKQPGFVEIDLVRHDGGDAQGDFIQTLDVTDVATSWTETEAVRNKAQVWVFEAVDRIRKRLPFPFLGIDSDNDVELRKHILRLQDKLFKLESIKRGIGRESTDFRIDFYMIQ